MKPFAPVTRTLAGDLIEDMMFHTEAKRKVQCREGPVDARHWSPLLMYESDQQALA